MSKNWWAGTWWADTWWTDTWWTIPGTAVIICLNATAGDAMGGYGITLADTGGGYVVTVGDASFCP